MACSAPCSAKDQWIVGHRIGFDQQGACGIVDEVEAGAHDLRLAAQAVRVLHALVLHQMRFADRAAGQQFAVDFCRCDLARLTAHFMHPRIERRIAAFGRIDRQRADHGRRFQHALGHEQAVQGQRSRDLGAVDQRQPFLGRQHHRLDAGVFQCRHCRHDFAVDAHIAFAQQRQRHVRQRRQIAGRADRSLGRNHRHDAGIDQCDHAIDHQCPDTGKTTRQAGDLHQHDQAHDGIAERLAGADRMRQDQVALQFLQLIVGDAGLGQDAETGVDAVGRIAAFQDVLHRRAGSVDRRIGRWRQRHVDRLRPDRAQIGQ